MKLLLLGLFLRAVGDHVPSFMAVKTSWLLRFGGGRSSRGRTALGRRTRRGPPSRGFLGGDGGSSLRVELSLPAQHGVFHVGKNGPPRTLCDQKILAEGGQLVS